MFDFSSLEPVSGNDRYSFVGISDGKLRLPTGCDAWVDLINGTPDAEAKFLAVREAFLCLFKILRKFRSTRYTELKNDRDSAQKGQNGGREILYVLDNVGEVIFYHHLEFLDSILDSHNDLSILSLAQRIGRSERINYEKMHKHLDRAHFMNDDTFIVNEMLLPRNELVFEPLEMVQLYCFVLFEVRKLLGDEYTVTSDIRVLAEQFFERHLAAGDSLFSFDSWARTRSILRERLEIIDANTTYKDDTYHDLYNALERFLWGCSSPDTKGHQWGISAFAPVWESMCLGYVYKTQSKQLVACDTSNIPDKALNKIQHLTHHDELDIDGKIISLRSTKEFYKIFIVNGTQVFPDCVICNDIEAHKNSWYKEYKVSSLADNQRIGSATAKIDHAFIPIWQGINSRSGPSQRTQAAALESLLRTGTSPGSLTAFFLGRAISGAFESTTTPKDAREIIFDKIIREKHAFQYYIHLLRGMAWEVYFHKDDSVRATSAINHRKSLFSYKLLIEVIEVNKNNPQINELSDFIDTIEWLIKGMPAPCTVIDFKYLQAEYFENPKNKENIRSRSIRKQFIYEYLIAKASGGDRPVKSEFWIPAYDDDIERIDLGPVQFLDGYIPLRRMNVLAIAEAYRKFE